MVSRRNRKSIQINTKERKLLKYNSPPKYSKFKRFHRRAFHQIFRADNLKDKLVLTLKKFFFLKQV